MAKHFANADNGFLPIQHPFINPPRAFFDSLRGFYRSAPFGATGRRQASPREQSRGG
jgi:hypothetical protein